MAHADALNTLRRAWPLPELHPNRRQGQLPAKLARHCRCAEAHLSRDPRDLVTILDSLRANPMAIPQGWDQDVAGADLAAA